MATTVNVDLSAIQGDVTLTLTVPASGGGNPPPPTGGNPELYLRERIPSTWDTLSSAEKSILAGIHLRTDSADTAIAQLNQLQAMGLKGGVSIKTESSNGNIFSGYTINGPYLDPLQLSAKSYGNPHTEYSFLTVDYCHSGFQAEYLAKYQKLAREAPSNLTFVAIGMGTDDEATVNKGRDGRYDYLLPTKWSLYANQAANQRSSDPIDAYFAARYYVWHQICGFFAARNIPVFDQLASVCDGTGFNRYGQFWQPTEVAIHGYKDCGVTINEGAVVADYSPGNRFGRCGLARWVKNYSLPYGAEFKGTPGQLAATTDDLKRQCIARLKRYDPSIATIQQEWLADMARLNWASIPKATEPI